MDNQKQLKDHREIGKELDLFSFNEYMPGAVFWHPKGWFVYQKIMSVLREMLTRTNYQEIKTPVMVKSDLFKRSGHWKHFGDTNMFNLTDHDDEKTAHQYTLKPMNCPEATLVYNSRPRSYRELPIKYSDFGILYRRELSGVLGGLFRVREFTIDDGHIFCRYEQISGIIKELLSQIQEFHKKFGTSLKFYVSTKPDKALELPDLPNLWPEAEGMLKKALEEQHIPYDIKEKDGAFYGPKIDFHMTDSQGRDWQLATVQIDFQMPRSLDVMFVNEKGEREYAVMLHRAFTGSIERFIGILIEQYQGSFPFWLAPVQVALLPISEKQLEYSEQVKKALEEKGIRVELDHGNKTIGQKIREATLQKVPYMVIIGDKETLKSDPASHTFIGSVRTREGEDKGQVDLLTFFEKSA